MGDKIRWVGMNKRKLTRCNNKNGKKKVERNIFEIQKCKEGFSKDWNWKTEVREREREKPQKELLYENLRKWKGKRGENLENKIGNLFCWEKKKKGKFL